MKMCVGGEWVDTGKRIEVIHPFDGSVVDTVPVARAEDVERALERAVEGARVMARMPAWERAQVLRRTADSIEREAEQWARTITLEEGKPIQEARVEVARAVETLRLSAEEARRIHGETVPLDAVPTGVGRFGFTLRVPCGVVVAISPFNFPLNLVVHKVGPALAGGNAVGFKPASATPLTALLLCEVLLEAGVPPEALSCLTGPGEMLGRFLASDRRVRKISFTGSVEVGNAICRAAGAKKVTMELGGNAPIVVMPDADLALVAKAVRASGFANAGQVCISAQRILVTSANAGSLIDALRPEIGAIRTGNPK
ncbi:MAG: aldehyde dehydrogenase family protein, partial [Verrucomicrobiae bacterium]|nr:aldehyde dehydrogenase family protein [Verrucomicrobiae bacterium]